MVEALVGAHRSSAAAKMLPLGFAAGTPLPFLRGDRDSPAMDIGDGSAIWTSMGDGAATGPANMVRARANGVRVVRLVAGCGLGCVGESRDSDERSVCDGKSELS